MFFPFIYSATNLVLTDQQATEYLKQLNTKQIIDLKAYGHIRKSQCNLMYQIHDLDGHVLLGKGTQMSYKSYSILIKAEQGQQTLTTDNQQAIGTSKTKVKCQSALLQLNMFVLAAITTLVSLQQSTVWPPVTTRTQQLVKYICLAGHYHRERNQLVETDR